MKILQTFFLLTCLCLASTTHAKVLWNNGTHVNSTVGQGNDPVMDDVYVPGAGWFVNEIESHGIFIGSNVQVSQVEVTIWFADIQTGEPDTNVAGIHFEPSEIDFVVTDTGEDWAGSNKYKVNITIPNTYLKGQRYYWIELDIRSEYGQRFQSLQTQNVNYLPAFTIINSTLCPHNKDVAFKLIGSEIYTIDVGASDEFAIEKPNIAKGTVSFQIKGEHKVFNPGVMQLSMLERQPVLYHFDRYGKTKLDFEVNSKGSHKLHTPIGDDMCEGAPGSLYEYCQTLVACAAYELFCPGFPTP